MMKKRTTKRRAKTLVNLGPRGTARMRVEKASRHQLINVSVLVRR